MANSAKSHLTLIATLMTTTATGCGPFVAGEESPTVGTPEAGALWSQSWLAEDGPVGGRVTSMTSLDGTPYAAASGVLYELVGDYAWSPVDLDLPTSNLRGIHGVHGKLLAADWGGELFRAYDGGTSWGRYTSGLQLGAMGTTSISALYPWGSQGVIVLAGDQIFERHEGDSAWTPVGMPVVAPDIQASVSALFAHDGVLLATELYSQNLYRSDDNGASWSQVTGVTTPSGPVDPYNCFTFVAHQDRLFASCWVGKLLVSSDQGVTWTSLLQPGSVLETHSIHELAATDTRLVARVSPSSGSSTTQMLHSEDYGATWQEIGGGLPARRDATEGLHCGGENCWAYGHDGIHFLVEGDTIWQPWIQGLRATSTLQLLSHSAGLISFGAYGQVFDVGVPSGGQTVGAGLEGLFNPRGVVEHHADLYFATSTRGLFRSGDAGGSWEPVTIPALEPEAWEPEYAHEYIDAVTATDSALYVLSGAYGVWRSLDDGATWTAHSDGLPRGTYIDTYDIGGTHALVAFGDAVHLTASNGHFRHVEGTPGWVEVPDFPGVDTQFSPVIRSFAQLGGVLYAASATGRGLFSSVDGLNWQRADLGDFDGVYVAQLLAVDDELLALAEAEGSVALGRPTVWSSTDGGATFQELAAKLPVRRGRALALHDGSLYLGTDGLGIWRLPRESADAEPVN